MSSIVDELIASEGMYVFLLHVQQSNVLLYKY
jgi:hypothetical protein